MDIRRCELSSVPWATLDDFGDRTIYQSREWLDFLVLSQGVEPVVLEITDGGMTIGWFTGAIAKKMGLRILCAPFRGWITGPMGFNLAPGVRRPETLEGLIEYAYYELKCAYVELIDPRLTFEEARSARGVGEVGTLHTFEIDLSPEPDGIFAAMSSACRRAVRKSQRSRVTIEIASGPGFADEYYEQLIDVFAKQRLSPPYSAERVRALIESVSPRQLLLLRARGPDGRSIATGIFPYQYGRAYFLGGASWREDQSLRPNEALFWAAMQILRERGVRTLDTGGGGEYKRKYGVVEVRLPTVRASRYPGVIRARNLAAKVGWYVATRQGRLLRPRS